jgi:hypothetical protein
MLSVLRRTVAVAALVALSAGAVEAQLSVEEIRLDVASFQSYDGFRALSVAGPGSVAIGVYLNDNIAIEPAFIFANTKQDPFDAVNFVAFSVFAPYYLAGDRGRSGVFIAPGLQWSKFGDNDAAIDFGADIGYKKPINDKVSWRAAANIRTGDSTNDDLSIGGTFGFSIFWK